MKSKAVTKPWKGAEPHIMGGVSAVNNTYNANAGTIQNATNQITGLLPSMIEKYQQGDAGVNAARNYNVGVLSGQYLNGNPYLDQMIGRSIDDSTNATQAALSLKGLTGGSDYANIISKNAGNLAGQMRYQDYDAERARMATAAGQSPGIAASDYLSITPMLSTLGAAGAPLDAASQYAQSLGGLLGGYQTQKSGNGVLGSLAQLGGMGLQAYGMGLFGGGK
jgi:hypothetical protein